ncbi:MAG TPA: 30S ribosome-binding factor RbfA [Bacteroidia bacterium]|nr:30S ribosome-binding factor RbfA [Bacteroidia bacterium]
MDSTRQNKFARLIQKEVAEIFQKEGSNFYGNSFVTVTKAKVTPDLSIARIYLSIFKDKDPNGVINHLKHQKHLIRKKLGNKIKNQARIIPELEFYLDDSLDYAEKIDNIMKDLHIPPEEESKQ